MTFNTGSFETGYFNPVLVGSTSGLVLYKCVYWVENATHGGDISGNEVDTLFDFISNAENIAGNTDYRKCHLKNLGTSTGDKVIRPVIFAPTGLKERLTVEIASGYDYDDMSNKPADGNFSDSLSFNLGTNAYQPFWLKRTISADADPDYYLNVKIALIISEA